MPQKPHWLPDPQRAPPSGRAAAPTPAPAPQRDCGLAVPAPQPRRSAPRAPAPCTWAWAPPPPPRGCRTVQRAPHPHREVGAGQWRPQHGILVQTLLQRQRRHHCPPGMVLLGYWCPEHGHEARTRRRQGGPGVEVQHLLGQPHHRLHAVIQPLRTQPSSQGRSLSEPAVEHTDLFVFPCGVGLRRHDRRGGRRGGARPPAAQAHSSGVACPARDRRAAGR